MQMNSNTTVTDLLFSGAFIEGANGESLTDLISVGRDRDWVHDLPISKLIERDAVVYLPNGMNISRSGYNVALKDDNARMPTVEFDNSDIGFRRLAETINHTKVNPALTIGQFQQEVAFA